VGAGGVARVKKVSLRSTDGEVDVSAIARAGGGGGHRQAAGFSTEVEDAALVHFLRTQVAAQLAPAST
jgi:phosphoesterase RecJ-like protein